MFACVQKVAKTDFFGFNPQELFRFIVLEIDGDDLLIIISAPPDDFDLVLSKAEELLPTVEFRPAPR